MKFQFKRIVIGGTFDHLHSGHEAFLSKAFRLGQEVVIGVTLDSMLAKKEWVQAIQPFKLRIEELKNFLDKQELAKRAKIVPINDPFGPSVKDPSLEAILATSETVSRAYEVNKIRARRNLSPLKIICTFFVRGTDGRRIASSRIRLGEEDRRGRVFTSKALNLGGRVLPSDIRSVLKKPIGILFKDGLSVAEKIVKKYDLGNQLVITVGDVVTSDFREAGITMALSIVDLRIGREKVFSSTESLGLATNKHVSRVVNRPGYVSSSLFFGIAKVMKNVHKGEKGFTILVSGQEDLAAIPAVLLSPLGSYVLYGQPNEGVVAVFVDEEIKQSFLSLLWRFEKV